MLTHASQANPREQWEVSSVWSQPWNCGMTAAAFIAGFYNDNLPFIEEGRRLIAGMGPYNVNGFVYYGCPPQTPTTAWQQADVLDRRGVPATARYLDTLEQLHGLVDSGRRPIIVGILMGRVPWQVRGHDFLGWHAIAVMCGTYSNGVRGFLVNDPNFPAGDPRSKRFYSDAVLQWALFANVPRWTVVPDYPKLVVIPDTALPGGSSELAWIHMVHFYAKPVKKRIIASPGSPTNLYKGPGRSGYPKHAQLTHDTFRTSVGTVTIPTGQTNAGIWVMFQEADGYGAFFAGKSRTRSS